MDYYTGIIDAVGRGFTQSFAGSTSLARAKNALLAVT
jgi:hypothetical protein